MSDKEKPGLFGEIAVREGLIDAGALGAALEAQEERKAFGNPRLIGQILVEKGLLSPQDVQRILVKQGLILARCGECKRGYTMRRGFWQPGMLCPSCRKPLAMDPGFEAPDAEQATPSTGAAGAAGQAQEADFGGPLEESDGLAPGAVIGGCEISGLLGRGGMGSVYKARHVGLNKTVAVKILSSALNASPGQVERFLLEARAAAKLDHQNIVGVLNVGRDLGRHFIVMQYVEGETLAGKLSREGRISPREVLRIAIQVARGLAAAHGKGIIHRDIKPSNVMIGVDGVVKVADFGLAKDLGSDAGLSRPGAVFGSPYYMSPEQAEGRRIDQRADIYSLGITLYHCLSGRRPFTAETPLGVLVKHIKEPMPPLSLPGQGIPSRLCGIVAKMTAKEPQDRYPDCEAMALEMGRVLAEIEAGPAPASGCDRGARIRVACAIAAILILIAAVAALGVSLGGGSPDSFEPPLPPEKAVAGPEPQPANGGKAAAPDPPADDCRHVEEARKYSSSHAGDPAGALVRAESLKALCRSESSRRAIEEICIRLREEAAGLARVSAAVLEEIREPLGLIGQTAASAAKAKAAVRVLRSKYSGSGWEKNVKDVEDEIARRTEALFLGIISQAEAAAAKGEAGTALRLIEDVQGSGIANVESAAAGIRARIEAQGSADRIRDLIRAGRLADAMAAGRAAIETGAAGGSNAAVALLIGHARMIEDGMAHVEASGASPGTGSFRPFYIDRFEVTNARFKVFMNAGGYLNPAFWPGQEAEEFRKALAGSTPWPRHWIGGEIPKGEEFHPARNITWFEAKAYCLWKGRRLPTEAEWMIAAGLDSRSGRMRAYPYGDRYDPAGAYTGKGPEFPPTAPVTAYPAGMSHFGLHHAAGNVYEWVDDWHAGGREFKVMKGGDSSDVAPEEMTRVDSRNRGSPDVPYAMTGFRTAADAPALAELGLK